MSTFTLSVRDSHTMLRRNLLHARRYPSLTLNLLLTPVMLLLLFVYVFGDVMSAGLGGGGADRDEYIAYLVPGILLMTVGSTVVGTAVSVSTDMNEGIIARFRTMAIRSRWPTPMPSPTPRITVTSSPRAAASRGELPAPTMAWRTRVARTAPIGSTTMPSQRSRAAVRRVGRS